MVIFVHKHKLNGDFKIALFYDWIGYFNGPSFIEKWILLWTNKLSFHRIKKEDIFEYGIKILRSISPTNDDTRLKTKHSKRDISINKDVYQAVTKLAQTKEGYIFDWNGFKQASQLQKLLKQLGLTKTTFHGLRDTHASFLFSKDISLDYISRRLGHNSILTTQQYYLELMPEKKHQQDADALSLLNDLSL